MLKVNNYRLSYFFLYNTLFDLDSTYREKQYSFHLNLMPLEKTIILIAKNVSREYLKKYVK